MGQIIFRSMTRALAIALVIVGLPLLRGVYSWTHNQQMPLVKSCNSGTLIFRWSGAVEGGLPNHSSSNKELQSTRLSAEQVELVVNDCFKGLFRVDTSLNPSFVLGDFDDDGTPDLFAAVRLAQRIRIDDKSDPSFNFQTVIDSTSRADVALKLKTGDLARPKDGRFWVVLHQPGLGKVTRCPSKLQTFVLLFPGDKGISTLRTLHGKRLPPGTIGDPKEDEPPPRLRGDAILLLDDKSYGEALYWDGSRYRWYPFNDAKMGSGRQ